MTPSAVVDSPTCLEAKSTLFDNLQYFFFLTYMASHCYSAELLIGLCNTKKNTLQIIYQAHTHPHDRRANFLKRYKMVVHGFNWIERELLIEAS